MKPVRIIGIGNDLAGDDAVGMLAARRLDDNPSEIVEVVEAGLSGLNLLDLMEGAAAVILIDAVRSGQNPGTIHRLEIPRDLGILNTHAWSSNAPSTHSFGMGESLSLSATLGTLPANVVIFGIEADDMTPGEHLSREVNQALDSLMTLIHKEVEAMTCMNSNS